MSRRILGDTGFTFNSLYLGFFHASFNYIRHTNDKVEYDFSKEDPLVKEMSLFVVDALEKSEKGAIYYYLTKRLAEALKRLSVSSARLRLSRKVETIDVRNALDVLRSALRTASGEPLCSNQM